MKRELWRTPLYPTFHQWTVALIIPSIVIVYTIEGIRPMAWSTAHSPQLWFLPLLGQKPAHIGVAEREAPAPRGAISRSPCKTEDVVPPFPPPASAKGSPSHWLYSEFSTLGKKGTNICPWQDGWSAFWFLCKWLWNLRCWSVGCSYVVTRVV